MQDTYTTYVTIVGCEAAHFFECTRRGHHEVHIASFAGQLLFNKRPESTLMQHGRRAARSACVRTRLHSLTWFLRWFPLLLSRSDTRSPSRILALIAAAPVDHVCEMGSSVSTARGVAFVQQATQRMEPLRPERVAHKRRRPPTHLTLFKHRSVEPFFCSAFFRHSQPHYHMPAAISCFTPNPPWAIASSCRPEHRTGVLQQPCLAPCRHFEGAPVACCRW